MSKFCGNCGAELDDSAQVCGFCGVSLNENFVKKIIPGIVNQANEEKVQKAKSLAKKFAPLAAVLVVVIIVISIIVNNTGYKGAVKKVMNAYQDCDAAALIEMRSGLYGEDEEDADELEEYTQDALDDMMDDFEDEVGNDVKIKYEIDVVKDLNDKKLEKLNDALDDEKDIDVNEVSAAKKISFKITLKGDDKEKSKAKYGDYFDMYILKEDGEWKFCNVSTVEGLIKSAENKDKSNDYDDYDY